MAKGGTASKKRKQLRTIKANYNGFGSVLISPDNQTLVSLNIDSPIDIWNRFTGRKIRTIKDEWVQSIDISPNGNTLVTGGWGDKTIKLWNIASKNTQKPLIKTLHGHTNAITSVTFHPFQNNLLASNVYNAKI